MDEAWDKCDVIVENTYSTHVLSHMFIEPDAGIAYLDEQGVMISAGECHTPGRPKDPSGTKALAIVGHKSFENAHPSSVKVEGGALILEKGLVEKDFEDLSKEGVWIVGEIGLGSVNSPELASPMVEWAHKYGFKVQMHTGGTSIPGSSTVTADDVIRTKPDVVSHINGGPTAIPDHGKGKLS